MTNGLTRFAIAGVGNVGVPTLDALLATPGLAKPVVLTRDAKKNAALQPYLAKTTVVDGVSYEDTEGLARVLKEHRVQVLIVTTGGENGPAQLPLATAAKQASLNLFVSAEFGIDFRFISDSELHPWILGRKQFHGTLNELGLAWISLATGLFAEFVLSDEIGFNPAKRTATLVGDEQRPFGSTSLKDIGRATVLAALAPVPPLGNGRTYAIAGFEASLADWLREAEKASGTKWAVATRSYEDAKSHQKEDSEEGFAEFLRASIADGRLLIPPSRLDNSVIGFKPEISLADAVKGTLA